MDDDSRDQNMTIIDCNCGGIKTTHKIGSEKCYRKLIYKSDVPKSSQTDLLKRMYFKHTDHIWSCPKEEVTDVEIYGN